MALNNDPRLKEIGISGVSLVRGGGVAALSLQVPSQPVSKPQPTPKKKRSSLRSCLVWGLIIGIFLIAGVVFAAPGLLSPPAAPVAPTATAVVIATDTSIPTEAAIPVTGPTATAVIPTKTQKPIPTVTETPIPQPVSCVAPQEATILQQVNCRYGPGSVYIYRAGGYPNLTVQVLGRADTAKGTWMYVQIPFQTPVAKCWINADPQFSEYQGDVSCLESYYPEKAPLPPYSEFPDRFPPPNDVYTERNGDQVTIYWTVHPLGAGDRSDRGQPPLEPLYLIETWTCQGGKITFTPQGYYLNDLTVTDPFLDGIIVTDEAGCSEPSHGRIYLAHADGYVGPVEIPWPK
jgi:hypothetical protein